MRDLWEWIVNNEDYVYATYYLMMAYALFRVWWDYRHLMPDSESFAYIVLSILGVLLPFFDIGRKRR